MAEDQGAEDKVFDPTPRKIEQAREEGDIVKSQDILTAAGLLGVVIAGYFMIGEIGAGFHRIALRFWSNSPKIVELEFQQGYAIGRSISTWVSFFAIPIVFVMIAVTAQRAWGFVPKKINPNSIAFR